MTTFPPWYDTAKTWLDTEFLVKNYFADMLPDTAVVSWLPPVEQVLADVQNGTVYLRVFRVGGQISGDDQRRSYVDRARMQFAVMSATRDDSWDVINFVRTVLWEYHEQSGRMAAAGIYAVLNTIGEIEGPMLSPVEFRDERLVPVTFDLEFQRPKGLPSYRIPLGL